MASALLIGTGEYTTGYVGGTASTSDKGSGVVGLTFFDLRKRKKVGSRIGLCGTSGTKFPGLRKHFRDRILEPYGLDVSCETFPGDDVKSDPDAYQTAINQFKSGDIAVVTTPDDTHFAITKAALERGLHVMVTKPIVKTLKEHSELAQVALKNKVVACAEYHKRHDPIYSDAVNRMSQLGDFSYFASYMSQPKKQLETFRAWAGKSSDISYYLNSHHIDVLAWGTEGVARCLRVCASGATGVAKSLGVDTEDTITILSEWENVRTKNIGIATFTSSWVAPNKSDVHSQQRFFYMGHKGELTVDQAHRGFTTSTDTDGFASPNPLYMRYTPSKGGDHRFAGQQGYGYRSFEVFVDAVNESREKKTDVKTLSRVFGGQGLCFLWSSSSLTTTAVLEAGRHSLDNGGAWYELVYNESDLFTPVDIRLQKQHQPTFQKSRL